MRGLPSLERERQLPDIAASFQEAVVDALAVKTVAALERANVKAVCLAGGVAANQRLRQRLRDEIESRDLPFYCPTHALCTDNAVMIGAVGAFYLNRGARDGFDLDAAPRLSLC